jgi:hypothetical protein
MADAAVSGELLGVPEPMEVEAAPAAPQPEPALQAEPEPEAAAAAEEEQQDDGDDAAADAAPEAADNEDAAAAPAAEEEQEQAAEAEEEEEDAPPPTSSKPKKKKAAAAAPKRGAATPAAEGRPRRDRKLVDFFSPEAPKADKGDKKKPQEVRGVGCGWWWWWGVAAHACLCGSSSCACVSRHPLGRVRRPASRATHCCVLSRRHPTLRASSTATHPTNRALVRSWATSPTVSEREREWGRRTCSRPRGSLGALMPHATPCWCCCFPLRGSTHNTCAQRAAVALVLRAAVTLVLRAAAPPVPPVPVHASMCIAPSLPSFLSTRSEVQAEQGPWQ